MWDWVVWGALIAGAAAVAAALGFAVVRAQRAWRDFKRARRRLFRALDTLLTTAERLAENAAGATDTRGLQASVARLRRSLARLAVLREAVDEARDTVGRFTAVMPRK